MNNKKAIYAAIGVGAAIAGYAIYRLTRKKKISEPMPSRRGNEFHHATDVFAKAKQKVKGSREEY